MSAAASRDEFTAPLKNIQDLESAGALAQKIIDNLSRPINLQGQEITTGVSIDISACPDHADNLMDLLRTADVAMYQTKGRGRTVSSITRATTNALGLGKSSEGKAHLRCNKRALTRLVRFGARLKQPSVAIRPQPGRLSRIADTE